VGNLEGSGKAALERYCKKLGIPPRKNRTGRYKKHRGSVRCETTDNIYSRMPCEPLRNTAINRNNINIYVSVILGTEG
jgi:hypothetical protein